MVTSWLLGPMFILSWGVYLVPESFAVVYQRRIVYLHSMQILWEGTSRTHTSNYAPAQPICPTLVSAPNLNLISNNSLKLPILES